MGDERFVSYVMLDYALKLEPGLARELLEDPKRVLHHLGVDAEALRCPEIAHEALEKAEDFAEELGAVDKTDLVVALPLMAEIASRRLGGDFTVTKEPFGLWFAERIRDVGLELTGTVSGECTFGLECHADVDR